MADPVAHEVGLESLIVSLQCGPVAADAAAAEEAAEAPDEPRKSAWIIFTLICTSSLGLDQASSRKASGSA